MPAWRALRAGHRAGRTARSDRSLPSWAGSRSGSRGPGVPRGGGDHRACRRDGHRRARIALARRALMIAVAIVVAALALEAVPAAIAMGLARRCGTRSFRRAGLWRRRTAGCGCSRDECRVTRGLMLAFAASRVAAMASLMLMTAAALSFAALAIAFTAAAFVAASRTSLALLAVTPRAPDLDDDGFGLSLGSGCAALRQVSPARPPRLRRAPRQPPSRASSASAVAGSPSAFTASALASTGAISTATGNSASSMDTAASCSAGSA